MYHILCFLPCLDCLLWISLLCLRCCDDAPRFSVCGLLRLAGFCPLLVGVDVTVTGGLPSGMKSCCSSMSLAFDTDAISGFVSDALVASNFLKELIIFLSATNHILGFIRCNHVI